MNILHFSWRHHHHHHHHFHNSSIHCHFWYINQQECGWSYAWKIIQSLNVLIWWINISFVVSVQILNEDNWFQWQTIQILNNLIYRVTYFECNPICSMSTTLLFSQGDFGNSDWNYFGFILIVDMAIGSLALLRCFWRVDLSSIFWSIFKPFSRTLWFHSWGDDAIFCKTISSNFHHRSVHSIVEKDRTSQVPF